MLLEEFYTKYIYSIGYIDSMNKELNKQPDIEVAKEANTIRKSAERISNLSVLLRQKDADKIKERVTQIVKLSNELYHIAVNLEIED